MAAAAAAAADSARPWAASAGLSGGGGCVFAMPSSSCARRPRRSCKSDDEYECEREDRKTQHKCHRRHWRRLAQLSGKFGSCEDGQKYEIELGEIELAAAKRLREVSQEATAEAIVSNAQRLASCLLLEGASETEPRRTCSSEKRRSRNIRRSRRASDLKQQTIARLISSEEDEDVRLKSEPEVDGATMMRTKKKARRRSSGEKRKEKIEKRRRRRKKKKKKKRRRGLGIIGVADSAARRLISFAALTYLFGRANGSEMISAATTTTTTTLMTTNATDANKPIGSTTSDVYGTIGKLSSLDMLLVLVLIALIFVSIIGNCLVCVAIFTDRRLRKLGNAFIVSLAIADLFVSCLVMTFALCNDLMNHWIFGEWFCDVWISFDIMCSTASILNLCAISLDRFIHIKDCYFYNQWMTKRIAISAVIVIWFISALVSFVPINLGWHKPSTTKKLALASVNNGSSQTYGSALALNAQINGANNDPDDVDANELAGSLNGSSPPTRRSRRGAPKSRDRYGGGGGGGVNANERARKLSYYLATGSRPQTSRAGSGGPQTGSAGEPNDERRAVPRGGNASTEGARRVGGVNEYSLGGNNNNNGNSNNNGRAYSIRAKELGGERARQRQRSLLIGQVSGGGGEEDIDAGGSDSMRLANLSSTPNPNPTHIGIIGGSMASGEPPPQSAASLPQCMLTLTPPYAVISSTISFYIPCIIMLGLYSKLFVCARKHVRNIQAVSKLGMQPSAAAKCGSQSSKVMKAASSSSSSSKDAAAAKTAAEAGAPSSQQQQPVGLMRTWIKFARARSNLEPLPAAKSADSPIDAAAAAAATDPSSGLKEAAGGACARQLRRRGDEGTSGDAERCESEPFLAEPLDKLAGALPAAPPPKKSSLKGGGGSGGAKSSSSLRLLNNIAKLAPATTTTASVTFSQAQATIQQQQSGQLATHKAAITLGIIMGTFLFCWVPFFCLNIIKAFCVDCIPSSMFRAFTWLGYANSALNPIIYGIHNSEFRHAFNRIFFRHLRFKNGRKYLNRRFSYDLRPQHQNATTAASNNNNNIAARNSNNNGPAAALHRSGPMAQSAACRQVNATDGSNNNNSNDNAERRNYNGSSSGGQNEPRNRSAAAASDDNAGDIRSALATATLGANADDGADQTDARPMKDPNNNNDDNKVDALSLTPARPQAATDRSVVVVAADYEAGSAAAISSSAAANEPTSGH